MRNMERSWVSGVLQVVLTMVCAGLVCAGLAVDCSLFVWALLGLGFAYGVLLVWKFGRRWWMGSKSGAARQERFFLLLVSLMFLFLVTGTALHLWAFTCEAADSTCDEGYGGEGVFRFINAEYLFRSLGCSFMLFAGNIDSNVLDGVRGHEYVKGLISLQAICSFLCTVAVLLSLVHARLSAYYRLHVKTKLDEAHNHFYVFFGMDKWSQLLAKSIKAKEGERAVVMFVENSQVDDKDLSGWNNIIGLFTHRHQTFSDVKELRACVTFTETRLCDIDKARLSAGGEVDVLEEMNLLKLRELIGQLAGVKDDGQLHVFFLSENEDENIRAMSTLALDKTIHGVKECAHFYCHARQNGLNRVVEDIAVKQQLDVHVVDSSHLAVELLKSDSRNHPVRLVDVDVKNPTTVSSPFTSLIVGFDEVGRDALKYLYEFGAFVDSSATPENDYRSPFRCVVVDKNMDELEGAFSTFAPAVMQQKNRDGSRLVELRQCNCLSSEFFKEVMTPNFCLALNYVVIAVGNDELGMMLAIRLLNHIRRERKDLSRLRIYVRSYCEEKENYMQQIADHYNEGYCLDCDSEEQKTDAVIIPFGQKAKIYSFDMIVNEELTAKGRRFQAEYARLKGGPKWDKRREDALARGSIDSLRSLRRKEAQDLANALHADTKMYLLKRSMPEDFDWEDFVGRIFDENGMPRCEGAQSKITYPRLDSFENRAMLNLARLEHIRWNASHEMLGYRRAHDGLHGPDERRREHNCLCPWQDLDKESEATIGSAWPSDYKSYDFCVVANSILLNKNEWERNIY